MVSRGKTSLKKGIKGRLRLKLEANRGSDGRRQRSKSSNTTSLRVVTFKRKKSSSKYQGVLYVKSQGKWRAQVCLNGKKKYLGSFDTELEAAIARDEGFKKYIKNTRPEMLNFPDRQVTINQPNYRYASSCPHCHQCIEENYGRSELQHYEISQKWLNNSNRAGVPEEFRPITTETTETLFLGNDTVAPELPNQFIDINASAQVARREVMYVHPKKYFPHNSFPRHSSHPANVYDHFARDEHPELLADPTYFLTQHYSEEDEMHYSDEL